ncbi:uncharacterized protein Bfra_005262 [Botrytis fragariae]|uniref:Uncharacterized protein n=1 Tax=Botrytis fragariae TaxID=1964551 RepID=A0A8H6EJ43_9HELO|nr:uncharacterized protein Bfra_005262 [Botrytis fragariae]KAF5873795.1 hypothetical protein Bfra_005262 [Botrytis fragariae]
MDSFTPLVLEAESNFLQANPDEPAVPLEGPLELKNKHNRGQSFRIRDGNVAPYYISSFSHGPAMTSQI